jgi:hydroxymethylglutaryl-CoA reductase (NADPH)
MYIYMYMHMYIYIHVHIYIYTTRNHIHCKQCDAHFCWVRLKPHIYTSVVRHDGSLGEILDWELYRAVQLSISEQLLRRNVEPFRGGLVFRAHRLLYHSTLGSRVIKKSKKKKKKGFQPHRLQAVRRSLLLGPLQTRNPKPKARNPKTETRNPKLGNRKTKPEIWNSKTETRKPKTETRSPEPGTWSPKPETRNPKPGTQNQKPGTRNPEPGTRNPKPETGTPEPDTRNPKPETPDPKPETWNPKPETGNREPEPRNETRTLKIWHHRLNSQPSDVLDRTTCPEPNPWTLSITHRAVLNRHSLAQLSI